MCLVLLAHGVHPELDLVVAANRDELHARPAAPLQRWEHPDHIWAGIDLEAGGTWMGLSSRRRLAAVTNLPGATDAPRSRGDLVPAFLDSHDTAADFAAQLDSSLYRGFNLVLWDGEELVVASSGAPPQTLPRGVYGVSNALPGTPWPKVTSGVRALERAVAQGPSTEELLAILRDDRPPPAGALPSSDATLDPELVRRAAARFVRHPLYGTRASTLALVSRRNATLTEHVFDASGGEMLAVQHAVPLTGMEATATL